MRKDLLHVATADLENIQRRWEAHPMPTASTAVPESSQTQRARQSASNAWQENTKPQRERLSASIAKQIIIRTHLAQQRVQSAR
jgi:hypothetical protein